VRDGTGFIRQSSRSRVDNDHEYFSGMLNALSSGYVNRASGVFGYARNAISNR
jgi:hypothetical protein